MSHEPDILPSGPASIRKYTSTDAPAVSALGKLAPQAAQWSAVSYEEAADAGQTILVAEAVDEICGFIVSRLVGSEGEILNMAVSPSWRRKGIGSQLLEEALNEARTRNVEGFYLEVRESNRGAISFYARHGFIKSGRRANYYSNPTENAVVMEKKLTGY